MEINITKISDHKSMATFIAEDLRSIRNAIEKVNTPETPEAMKAGVLQNAIARIDTLTQKLENNNGK